MAFGILAKVAQAKGTIVIDPGPRPRNIWLSLIAATFTLGALARIAEQISGLLWLDALVPVFGGLFLLAIFSPLVLLRKREPYMRLKTVLAWLAAVPMFLVAASFIALGITRLVVAL